MVKEVYLEEASSIVIDRGCLSSFLNLQCATGLC
jgi:hypothetical protein